MESEVSTGIAVEEQPLVSLLYRMLREGDVSPARLEQLLGDLEEMPAAVSVAYGMPDIARHAFDAAARLERLRRPPIEVHADR